MFTGALERRASLAIFLGSHHTTPDVSGGGPPPPKKIPVDQVLARLSAQTPPSTWSPPQLVSRPGGPVRRSVTTCKLLRDEDLAAQDSALSEDRFAGVTD